MASKVETSLNYIFKVGMNASFQEANLSALEDFVLFTAEN